MLPILLLIGLMVVLGQLNIDLARPFTAPRLISDAQGGFLFYGGGTRDPGFFFRRVQSSDEKVTFAKRRFVPGVLASAALLPEHLVTLYAGEREDAPWFYSLTRRETLERTWSGFLTEPELGLTFPRHLATIHSQVYVFGSDAAGSIRVARLDVDPLEEGRARPEAVLADVPGGAHVAELPADAKERVPPPLAYASVLHEDRLYLFWRVSTESGRSRQPAGEVRWTRFDGKAFETARRFQADLQSFTPVVGLDGTLRIYGVKHDATDSQILSFELEGEDFRPGAPLSYEREGLGGAGVSALAAGQTQGRVFLFAQIGAAIRYLKDEGEGFGKWKDVARRPAEQTAIVYGWFAALIGLSVLLILQGLRALRSRRPPPPGSTQTLAEYVESRAAPAGPELEREAQPETAAEVAVSEPVLEADLASLPERALAFGFDLVLLFVILRVLGEFLPWLDPRVALEPPQQLTFAAWATGILILYFTAFESLFSRTPGKRFLGLEVQDVDGEPISPSAALFRNAFRVELLIPPFYVVPVISLVLMLTSRYTQRPGDLVAHTTVRRTRQRHATLAGEPIQE